MRNKNTKNTKYNNKNANAKDAATLKKAKDAKDIKKLIEFFIILFIVIGIIFVFPNDNETTTSTAMNKTPKTTTPEQSEYKVDAAYVAQITAWTKKVLDEKNAYLVNAQLKPAECKKALNTLEKAGTIAGILQKNGQHDLGEILYHISNMKSQLGLYIYTVEQNPKDTKSAKYFMEATNSFDAAIKLFNKL